MAYDTEKEYSFTINLRLGYMIGNTLKIQFDFAQLL